MRLLVALDASKRTHDCSPSATLRQKSKAEGSAERHVKEIKRQTRRKFSAEEKIRIILEGLRGEYSIAELCRREGIAQGLYYTWSKDFMGKRIR
ncbi:MAG: transposase [Hyphomonas sp.]|jgi:transposase